MVKEIRNQVYCMTFVLGMLMCLGLWQMDFIVNAISANLFLNISIFATFGFGTYVAYTNVLSLKNECLVTYFCWAVKQSNDVFSVIQAAVCRYYAVTFTIKTIIYIFSALKSQVNNWSLITDVSIWTIWSPVWKTGKKLFMQLIWSTSPPPSLTCGKSRATRCAMS